MEPTVEFRGGQLRVIMRKFGGIVELLGDRGEKTIRLNGLALIS